MQVNPSNLYIARSAYEHIQVPAPLLPRKALRAILEGAFSFSSPFPYVGTAKYPRTNFEIANKRISERELRYEKLRAQRERENRPYWTKPYRGRTPQLALRRNVLKGHAKMKKKFPGVFVDDLPRHQQWTRERIGLSLSKKKKTKK